VPYTVLVGLRSYNRLSQLALDLVGLRGGGVSYVSQAYVET